MLKRRKKFMAKMLILTMFTSVVPAAMAFMVQKAEAVVSVTAESNFTFDAATGTIKGYNGTDTTIVIPSTISGVSVKSIGNYAFSSKNSLKSVTIPNGVTSIGNWAFGGCSNLTNINIPDGVTSFGYSSFIGCSALTSITIPASVTSIGQTALGECGGNIYVNDNNTVFKSVDGVLYSKDGTKIIQCPSGKTSMTILDGVTTIGYCAFYQCNSLKSIAVPDSVTSIDKGGFEGAPNATFYVKSEKIKNLLISNSISESRIMLNSQPSAVKVTSIALNTTSLSLIVGQTGTFAATIVPSNATNKGLTWTSGNSLVATVDSNGKVTALGLGSATISCTATDGSGVVATTTVNVSAQTNSVLKSVSISGTEEVGDKLRAKVNYSGTKPSLEYQWQRASKKDGDYTDISGADEEEYRLKSSDKNKYIKVIVTATINGTNYTVEDKTSKIDRNTSEDDDSDSSSHSHSHSNSNSSSYSNSGSGSYSSTNSNDSNNDIDNVVVLRPSTTTNYSSYTTNFSSQATGSVTSNSVLISPAVVFTNPAGHPMNGWVNASNKWYYFDTDGRAKVGWILYNSKWYYLDQSGVMISNTTIDGYTLGADGAMI